MTACGGNLIGSEVKMKEQSLPRGAAALKFADEKRRQRTVPCLLQRTVPCLLFQLPVER